MDVMYPRCAGLDVHKDVVVACVRIAQAEGKTLQEVRSFATTTSELRERAAREERARSQIGRERCDVAR
jgi:hypothetical protein